MASEAIRIGHTKAELEAELGTPLPVEGARVVNDQENLLMVFILNPDLYFTYEDLAAIDLFTHISQTNLRGKVRYLCNNGMIQRLSPGVFRFNPAWLKYKRI